MTGPTRSVAVAGAYVTTAPDGPVASRTRSLLHEVIVGGVVSRTVTVNVFTVQLPTRSNTVTVTVVVPIAKTVPAAFEYWISVAPSASVATAGA